MSGVEGEKLLLLQAALDNELDAAGMLAFERALAEDEELAAEYGRQKALRDALRALPKAVVSGALRGQIEALAPRKPKRAFQWLPGGGSAINWMPTALAASLAFLIGSGLTFLALPQEARLAPSMQTESLLADHVRGMISGQPVDVVSSERHTVKPWFGNHIALSPRVVDLKDEGFPLIGGRIDVIGVTPVPTLVFRRYKHTISLSEVPEDLASVPPGLSTLNGFAVLTWRQGKTVYVAISDAAPNELEALKTAFQKATAAEP
jgi:anti-sigma factor RsiW